MKRTPEISALFTALLMALPLAGCAVDAGEETGDEPVDTSQEALAAFCDDVLTTDPAFAAFEQQVLDLTNQRRAAGANCGGTPFAAAPPLTFDARLQCAARKHSKDMTTKNFFSHTGSDGSTLGTREKAAGYTFKLAAENIAAGQTTPAAVVDAWMTSTGHCQNIMNKDLKNLGVGYSFSSTTTFKHYWTQDFGTPL